MKQPIVKKVNIEMLMATLADLWNGGVQFVDIYGKLNNNDEPDAVWLAFEKDYMHPKYVENFNMIINKEDRSKINVKKKLSDDDLNELI
jgi:hypothetical protein